VVSPVFQIINLIQESINSVPHLQLKLALKKDFPALKKAIRANPEEAKKTSLGRLLIEEGIVSLTN
jgi:hypothetical protein